MYAYGTKSLEIHLAHETKSLEIHLAHTIF